MEEWLAAEQDEPPEWRKAATTNSGTAYLTPEELAEFADEVRELWRKYERLDSAERPEGSRRIHIVFRAIPRVEPKPKRREKWPIPRIEQYARIMVEDCIDVQPGWQVVVVGGPSRPADARGGAAARWRAAAPTGCCGRLRRQPAPSRRLGGGGADGAAAQPAAARGRVLEQADALIVDRGAGEHAQICRRCRRSG